MELIVDHEVAVMERMTTGELRAKFLEVCGEPTATRNRTWLIRRIAWRMQANAYGGLSEPALARARELANDADLRVTAPRANTTRTDAQKRTVAAPVAFTADSRLPVSGTLITREYKGQTLRVKVLPKGFEFDGIVYKSLSAVAKHITGSHCNGYLFFRLRQEASK